MRETDKQIHMEKMMNRHIFIDLQTGRQTTYEQMDEQAGEHTYRLAERQMNRQGGRYAPPLVLYRLQDSTSFRGKIMS
jgi:hypothetical protein